MSHCSYCRQRKGKRACPALAGLICSQCCGEHRIVRVLCPADCVFLESGSDYQQKRLAEQFMPVRRDFYRELEELGSEKAVALFNLVEIVIFSYFQGRRDRHDAEVVAALQALRRTLSPLHIPAAPMPVFAERLKKEYDAFKKQNPQQIADTSSAPEILDRAIAFVSRFSGTDLQSQRFLGGLVGYVRAYHPEIAQHLAQQREPGHIILPGQQFMPPAAPEPHTHGPGCHHH